MESSDKAKIEYLKHEIERRDRLISALEAENKRLMNESGKDLKTDLSVKEIEAMLRRLIARVSMLIRCDKCVCMLHDRETDELYATKPAFGFTDEQINAFRLSTAEGIGGECFRKGKPIITNSASTERRMIQRNIDLIGIKNSVCVPLILVTKDENTGKIIRSETLGIMWCFNKRHGERFTEEDVNVLRRMSGNVASVIAGARTYRNAIKRKNELRNVIESVNSGLIMVNVGGTVMQINRAARHMLGIGSDVKVHGYYREIIDNSDVREVIRAAIHGEDEPREIAIDRNGRRHIYKTQVSAVRTDENVITGIAVILNDVTEIRNLDKMKTSFISTVSHELRTPLTSIKGFISTLVECGADFDHDTIIEFYRIIDLECDRLMRLVSDLLSLTRIEDGRGLELNLSEVDLGALLEKVAAAQRAYEDRCEIVTDIDPNLPKIEADGDKLDQIFTNLAANAVKYSPDGGEIRIKARREGDNVAVSVIDHGVGMEEEELKKIFERFYRVDSDTTRTVPGSGIGLYLVKNLTDLHGGICGAESKPGRGSTFTVTLPIHQKGENK